jgi:hypothetical protein
LRREFWDLPDSSECARGELKNLRVFLVVLFLAAGGAAYYFLVYLPAHPKISETAYVLPSSVPLVDSRAEIHNVIENLKNGERVEIISKDNDWAQLRLPDGKRGWLETQYLMDSQTYEGGQRLQKELEGIPVQAVGHTSFDVNLRLAPSRDGSLLERLNRNESLKIFGRRLVPRFPGGAEGPASSAQTTPAPSDLDAWYLVEAGSRAGWVLGKLVTLDIPQEISPYAQNFNMVAWLVLNTVDDNGRQVPQYVAADREGTQECDFTHIRVFTWGAKEGKYATAYVKSNLKGYFPIQVERSDGVPEFRLRLEDAKGRKIQKVYKLMGTVVRPQGIVEGWTSRAPAVAAEKSVRRRRRTPQGRR